MTTESKHGHGRKASVTTADFAAKDELIKQRAIYEERLKDIVRLANAETEISTGDVAKFLTVDRTPLLSIIKSSAKKWEKVEKSLDTLLIALEKEARKIVPILRKAKEENRAVTKAEYEQIAQIANDALAKIDAQKKEPDNTIAKIKLMFESSLHKLLASVLDTKLPLLDDKMRFLFVDYSSTSPNMLELSTYDINGSEARNLKLQIHVFEERLKIKEPLVCLLNRLKSAKTPQAIKSIREEIQSLIKEKKTPEQALDAITELDAATKEADAKATAGAAASVGVGAGAGSARGRSQTTVAPTSTVEQMLTPVESGFKGNLQNLHAKLSNGNNTISDAEIRFLNSNHTTLLKMVSASPAKTRLENLLKIAADLNPILDPLKQQAKATAGSESKPGSILYITIPESEQSKILNILYKYLPELAPKEARKEFPKSAMGSSQEQQRRGSTATEGHLGQAAATESKNGASKSAMTLGVPADGRARSHSQPAISSPRSAASTGSIVHSLGGARSASASIATDPLAISSDAAVTILLADNDSVSSEIAQPPLPALPAGSVSRSQGELSNTSKAQSRTPSPPLESISEEESAGDIGKKLPPPLPGAVAASAEADASASGTRSRGASSDTGKIVRPLPPLPARKDASTPPIETVGSAAGPAGGEPQRKASVSVGNAGERRLPPTLPPASMRPAPPLRATLAAPQAQPARTGGTPPPLPVRPRHLSVGTAFFGAAGSNPATPTEDASRSRAASASLPESGKTSGDNSPTSQAGAGAKN